MSKTADIEQLLKLKHYNRFTRYRTTTVTKRRAGSLLRLLLPGHQSKEHNHQNSITQSLVQVRTKVINLKIAYLQISARVRKMYAKPSPDIRQLSYLHLPKEEFDSRKHDILRSRTD